MTINMSKELKNLEDNHEMLKIKQNFIDIHNEIPELIR